MKQGFERTRHGCIQYCEVAVGKTNVAMLTDCEHFPMIDDSALFGGEVARPLNQVSN
jgi:hypothetical protein